VPVRYEEKEEELWELNTYVTCEVLGWKGVWNAEERRRRGNNDLGLSLYYGFPYYGRWIWAAARMLVDKNHVSLTELLEKIAEVRARNAKQSANTGNVPARFNVGDRVRVKELPNLFYTRTQMYVRGVSGTIAARTYEDLIPEDEAWNRDDAQPEQFYIVRFRQKDLWEEYPFDNDTLQTEFPDRWLEPA
jgi:hypothetical protein